MVILDIYILGSIVKNKISIELDATMIITVDHSWIHHLVKQSNKYLSHPDLLTCCLIGSHVLCFCQVECHRSLLPAVPRNRCGPNTENSTWCTILAWWTPRSICIYEATQLHSLFPSVLYSKLGSASEVP